MNDYLSRIVADSRDRPAWLDARAPGIGGSDAANFAKLSSVESYTRAKLRGDAFTGNAYTDRGNRWEPAALAAYGFRQNFYMYRHPDNPLHLATPDGIRETESGLLLAETKTLLLRDDVDPNEWEIHVPPRHLRQIAWTQYVLGSDLTEYIVLPCDSRHIPLLMTPRRIFIPRDDELIATLVEIATPVLAAMKRARDFERNNS